MSPFLKSVKQVGDMVEVTDLDPLAHDQQSDTVTLTKQQFERLKILQPSTIFVIIYPPIDDD